MPDLRKRRVKVEGYFMRHVTKAATLRTFATLWFLSSPIRYISLKTTPVMVGAVRSFYVF